MRRVVDLSNERPAQRALSDALHRSREPGTLAEHRAAGRGNIAKSEEFLAPPRAQQAIYPSQRFSRACRAEPRIVADRGECRGEASISGCPRRQNVLAVALCMFAQKSERPIFFLSY
jgi:hypothetical protein